MRRKRNSIKQTTSHVCPRSHFGYQRESRRRIFTTCSKCGCERVWCRESRGGLVFRRLGAVLGEHAITSAYTAAATGEPICDENTITCETLADPKVCSDGSPTSTYGFVLDDNDERVCSCNVCGNPEADVYDCTVEEAKKTMIRRVKTSAPSSVPFAMKISVLIKKMLLI